MERVVPVITLTTDFGTKDGFVGTLKGVIWSICPSVQIADISHEVTPQNILEGAYALWRAVPFFPKGTIHLAVVDPGVGTQRRPIALHSNGQYYVGPDNGLFTPILEDADKNGWKTEIFHLTNPKYFLPDVSNTFHGRDIFAPVSAHLARGVALEELGPVLADPVRIQLPKPEKTASGWRATITVVDVFGNCTTNLPAVAVPDRQHIILRVLGHEIRGLVDSYGHSQPGELVALVDSENFIEVAVVNGSAAHLLSAEVGDLVEVIQ